MGAYVEEQNEEGDGGGDGQFWSLLSPLLLCGVVVWPSVAISMNVSLCVRRRVTDKLARKMLGLNEKKKKSRKMCLPPFAISNIYLRVRRVKDKLARKMLGLKDRKKSLGDNVFTSLGDFKCLPTCETSDGRDGFQRCERRSLKKKKKFFLI